MYLYSKVLKDHNINISQIAEKLECVPNAVHEILKGSPSVSSLTKVADAIGADVAEFFTTLSKDDERLKPVIHLVSNCSYNYKQVFKAHNITVYELAAKLGMSPQGIYRCLKQNPNIRSLLKFAKAMNADIIEFFLPFSKDDERVKPILRLSEEQGLPHHENAHSFWHRYQKSN